MSGSSVVLWLEAPLDDAAFAGLVSDLERETRAAARVVDRKAHHTVEETSPFYVSGCVSPCELIITLSDADISEGDDYSQVPSPPRQELIIAGGGKGIADNIIVGRVALHLMDAYPSLLDFDGLIGPGQKLPEEEKEDDWNRVQEVRGFMSSLPGDFAEVGYCMLGEDMRYVHVVDREFFAAWLRHPEFRLLSD